MHPIPAKRWQVWATAAALAVAVVVVYANCFRVPLLLDDFVALGHNKSVRDLRDLGQVLHPADQSPTAGRPLLNLSFAIDCAWSTFDLRGFHAINLGIHVLAALTLFGLARRTLLVAKATAPTAIAFVLALVWGLHPLQTEAVTYLSQRAESLMGLFYLLTLYGFVRSATGNAKGAVGWGLFSVAACYLGMATKEVMMTAPLLVLLYDRAFLSPSLRAALARRTWYYGLLGSAWVFLGCLIRSSHLFSDRAIGFGWGTNAWDYAMTEAVAVVKYAKLAIWPHPLVFDYGLEIWVHSWIKAAPFVLVVAAAVAGSILAWRRSKPVGFLAIAFFVLLAPTSSVVPVAGNPMAESRMYLPLATLAALATAAAWSYGGRRALLALGAVAAVLGAATLRRNDDYRSAVSIWTDTVAKMPGSSRAHGCLAHALSQIPGREADALAEFHAALKINPNSYVTHFEFARLLETLPGRESDAISEYERVLVVDPAVLGVHDHLALLLEKVPGREVQAVDEFEFAVMTEPGNADAHYHLANALSKLRGGLKEAIFHYETAVRLNPDLVEAQYNLANKLAAIPDRRNEAIAHYEAALRLKPDYEKARNNLAALCARLGRMSEAVQNLELAVKFDPSNALARENLAALRSFRK